MNYLLLGIIKTKIIIIPKLKTI